MIIVFAYAEVFRNILYQAYLNGMANGDYVFITLELWPSDWLGHYQKFIRGRCAIMKYCDAQMLAGKKYINNIYNGSKNFSFNVRYIEGKIQLKI